MTEEQKTLADYFKTVGSEVIGWFLGGAVAVLAAKGLDADALKDVDVWQGAATAGVLGVLKGLVSRFTGDPNSGRLTQ